MVLALVQLRLLSAEVPLTIASLIADQTFAPTAITYRCSNEFHLPVAIPMSLIQTASILPVNTLSASIPLRFVGKASFLVENRMERTDCLHTDLGIAPPVVAIAPIPRASACDETQNLCCATDYRTWHNSPTSGGAWLVDSGGIPPSF